MQLFMKNYVPTGHRHRKALRPGQRAACQRLLGRALQTAQEAAHSSYLEAEGLGSRGGGWGGGQGRMLVGTTLPSAAEATAGASVTLWPTKSS